MKKLSMLFGIMLSILLFSSFTYAAPITNLYTQNPTNDIFIGNSPNPSSYSFIFDNYLQDFQPGSITGATLTVYLKDDDDPGVDKFTLNLIIAPTTYLIYDSGNKTMPNTLTAYSGSILSYINNGSFGAQIARSGNNNDFFFDRFELSITGDAPVVPIPATAWLLGTGLIGLVAIRRRKK
jgi:hypothetical protein